MRLKFEQRKRRIRRGDEAKTRQQGRGGREERGEKES